MEIGVPCIWYPQCGVVGMGGELLIESLPIPRTVVKTGMSGACMWTETCPYRCAVVKS